MVPCEAFWHMDTTNCNLSKLGSKIIATSFCETRNRILKAWHCIALKPEWDEKWKPRNSINSDELCLTSTRHFWKMYRKWKFPNFQIYGFYDFFSSKAWNIPKNTQNSILCTLWHNLSFFPETILSWTCRVYGPFEFRTSLGTSILLIVLSHGE